MLPAVVPKDVQVNLLGFVMSPGAVSQRKRVERIQDTQSTINGFYSGNAMQTYSLSNIKRERD